MTPPDSPRVSRLARLPIFYGWVVVAAAFITMAVSVNSRTAFSLLFPSILHEFGGGRWRAACWSLAITVIVVLIPVNLLLRRRPEDIGLRPDGDSASDMRAAGARVNNIVDPAWAATTWTLARALRTARFWWIALGYFCALHAWYVVQVHQTKYLIEIGFDPMTAAWALGLVALVAIPGQIWLGHLSDRIG